MEELPNSEIKSAVRDDGKFRLLYDHYSPYVWRVVFRTVQGDADLAQQVLQSVFISVHRNLRKFRYKSAFSTWLYQIAWRECLYQLKKRKNESHRFTEISENDLPPGEDDGSAKEQVERLLEQLSQEERFLLVSKEIDGFSFDELAEITGRKSGALRTALSRIKQKMREVSHG